MTQAELDARKADWRKQLETRTAEVLESLTELLPQNRAKSKQVTILAARAQRILSHEINNTLATAELEVLRNQLLNDLLLFIQYLVTADFSQEAPVSNNYRDGHLLYQIPDRMQKGQRYECRVRIARQIELLLKDLEDQEFVKVEDIPVARVMEVEIIDPSAGENPAFDVLLLSDADQVIEELDYTEWLFLIRPLLPGKHELYIRVSVLFDVDGKERRKNVLVNRRIEVLTELKEEDVVEPVLTQVIAESPLRSTEDKEGGSLPGTGAASGGSAPTGTPPTEHLDYLPQTGPASPPAMEAPIPDPAPVPTETKRRQPPWSYILGVLLIGAVGVFALDYSLSKPELFPEGYIPENAPAVEVVTDYCFVCEELGVISGEKPLRRSRLLLTDCQNGETIANLGEVPNCCLDLNSQRQRAADWQNGKANIYELWPGPIVTRQKADVKPELADLSNARDTIYIGSPSLTE
ncbi:MAG: hypothetical protein AAFY91_09230 [Bacteroidota bacterium]